MKQKKPTSAKKAAYIALAVFISCFAFLSMNCKKQSTAPEISFTANDNNLLISCSPSSGGKGTLVDLKISILGNSKEIKSFGMKMTFDPAIFQYESAGKGDLTGNWAAVDGNESNPGKLIIGGFMGSGIPVPAGSSGSLAIIKIKVIYDGNDDGFSRQFSLKNYIDDIVGMKPEPSSTAFTFRK